MKNRYIKSLIESAKTIISGVVFALLITTVIQPTIVSGKSMYPNLDDRDYLIVNKLAYKKNLPERGDIVVFDSNIINEVNGEPKKLIKRVIGLPGDRVEIVNGFVYINDEKLEEAYLDGVFTDGEVDMVVPDNSIYVLGDNRPNSGDSRLEEIGAVSMDTVMGEAIFRLFPFDKIGKIG